MIAESPVGLRSGSRLSGIAAFVNEFDSGHTIHRDRFDTYLAEVLRWLGGH